MPRILIVEDSPTQARKLALFLEEAGFDVATASERRTGTGASAARALRSGAQRPDPARRQRLRPVPAHQGRPAADRGLPVVVLTSQADPVNVLRGSRPAPTAS